MENRLYILRNRRRKTHSYFLCWIPFKYFTFLYIGTLLDQVVMHGSGFSTMGQQIVGIWVLYSLQKDTLEHFFKATGPPLRTSFRIQFSV